MKNEKFIFNPIFKQCFILSFGFVFFLVVLSSCSVSKEIEKNTVLTTIQEKIDVDTTIKILNPIKQSFDSAKISDTIKIITKDYSIISYADTLSKKIFTKVKPIKKKIDVPIKIQKLKTITEKKKTYSKKVERKNYALVYLLSISFIGFIIAILGRYLLKKIFEKW